MQLDHLIEKHANTLKQSVEAVQSRQFYAHWPEPPSGKIYGETAQADGLAAFQSSLHSRFELPHQNGSSDFIGDEQSPYGFPLEITYPSYATDSLIEQADNAKQEWKSFSTELRAAILIECLERASKHFFEIGFATMHTTGQGFIMAFQASGPHAFDRALEAIATGYMTINQFCSETSWTKPMGKFEVTLQKSFRIIPKGINVTIGCSTFPIWNSFPGIFASLITGNTSIAKAHPRAILPIAICIKSFQDTLVSLGLNPHIIQLAVDSLEEPITMQLAKNHKVTLIDYTGSSHFGSILEQEISGTQKNIFTEKAGVNSVLIAEANSLDAVLDNLAFSVSLYSGQMCTAPQNFYIPKQGVKVGDSYISYDEVMKAFAEKVQALVLNEKMGPGTLGALQNPAVLERVNAVRKTGLPIVLDSHEVKHQGFDNALSVSPIILSATMSDSDIYEQEWFGPICFIIKVEDIHQGIDLISSSIKKNGALSTAVYIINHDDLSYAEEQITMAGAPLACNLTGPIWVNQSAAFSDFHGTGANPAGNASFTDITFISSRYNIIGIRKA